MKLLITGATGFIGQHLVEHLLANGRHELALLVREGDSMGTPLPTPLQQRRQQFQVVYGDLRNFRLTARAVKESRPQMIIHLATMGSTEPFLPLETALRHNFYGTLNLVRACFEKGDLAINRLIAARTPGEMSHMNTYATSKLAAWDFCTMFAQNHGWPITGGMIYQCYGPRQSNKTLVSAAIRRALAHENFPMTAGTQEKDWIYIDDVVRAFVEMATVHALPKAETIHIGTGQSHSVAEVAQLIYQLAESKGRPQVGVLPNRPGEAPVQKALMSHTQRFLPDWAPKTTLKDGLQHTIDDVRTDSLPQNKIKQTGTEKP